MFRKNKKENGFNELLADVRQISRMVKQARERMAKIEHVKQTVAWLNPEYTNDQVNMEVMAHLSVIADEQLLDELISMLDTRGEQKLSEVTSLHELFDNETDN